MYTSALEMHIEVQQGLQKISAYTEDMFDPEEIDLHLTKQQNRLVEEIINNDFQDTQTSLDYIKPLIVKNAKLQVILPKVAESIYEPSMVYGLLPADYLHLVNDRSSVITSTTAKLCNDISAYKTNVSFQTNFIEYTAAVPMVVSTAVTAPYFYKFTITITKGGSPVTVTVPASLWNIKSPNSGFYISRYIMENDLFPSLDINIYWERYRDSYAPGSFIFVTKDITISQVSLNCTISAGNLGNGGSSTGNFITSGTYVKPKYEAIPGFVSTYTSNTLTETDDLYTQNTNVFYKPKLKSPKSVLADQYLFGYESKNFLINEFTIDYVRIPKQISLSLNQISELGGNGPSIVVDRTVEYLKLAIENPAYSGVMNDNTKRDQL